MTLRAGLSVLLLSCLAAYAVACGARPDGAVQSDGDAGARAPTRAERRAAEKIAHTLDTAEVEAARGQSAEAESHYREVLEARPGDRRALAGLVRVLIERGDFAAAVFFDDEARTSGDDVRHSLSERERCVLWLSAARAHAHAHAHVAGEIEGEAATLLDRIDATPGCSPVRAAAGPIRADIHVLAADLAAREGRPEAEIASLRAAVSADPDRVEVTARLARALLDRGERREALGTLTAALERHPESRQLEVLMLEALGVPDPRFGASQ